jgi:hypothetical protein
MLFEDQSQPEREHWLSHPIVLRAFSWKSFLVVDLFSASPPDRRKDRNRATSSAGVNSKLDLITKLVTT